MESIENIRKNAIDEIKEKVKKNPKYLHPTNKERLEDMKKLMFVSGNEFVDWMRQNGILVSTISIRHKNIRRIIENAGCKTEQEYRNKLAQRSGFKDFNDQRREWRHERGENLPLEFNEDCSSWFGDFTENLMIHRYPGAKKMPYGNQGFDYLWNGEKIDNKGRCLKYYGNWSGWGYDIGYNNVTKKFILSGWDNRESLNPLFAFEFDKNDLVRIGKGNNVHKVEFWKRDSFTITNTPEGLEQFGEYQIDIDWLKELCSRDGEK